jgi:hypothetical protein
MKRSGDAQVHLDLLEAARPWYERDSYWSVYMGRWLLF